MFAFGSNAPISAGRLRTTLLTALHDARAAITSRIHLLRLQIKGFSYIFGHLPLSQKRVSFVQMWGRDWSGKAFWGSTNNAKSNIDFHPGRRRRLPFIPADGKTFETICPFRREVPDYRFHPHQLPSLRITSDFGFNANKSHSLNKHLRDGWAIFNPELREFIIPVPAQMNLGEHWYEGTADAIFQNMNLFDRNKSEHTITERGIVVVPHGFIF